MPKPKKAMSADYEKFEQSFLERHEQVTQGSLFGMTCLKRGKKAFAGSFDGGLVVRLDEEGAEKALGIDGAKPFDPSGKGRPMKGWVVLPASAKRRWASFARAAYEAQG